MHEVRRACPVPIKKGIWSEHGVNSTAYVGMVTSVDQPGKVANPARGQLNKKK